MPMTAPAPKGGIKASKAFTRSIGRASIKKQQSESGLNRKLSLWSWFCRLSDDSLSLLLRYWWIYDDFVPDYPGLSVKYGQNHRWKQNLGTLAIKSAASGGLSPPAWAPQQPGFLYSFRPRPEASPYRTRAAARPQFAAIQKFPQFSP